MLVFCYCDKIPEENSTKEETFILAGGFRPLPAGSVGVRPVARWNVTWQGGAEETCSPRERELS